VRITKIGIIIEINSVPGDYHYLIIELFYWAKYFIKNMTINQRLIEFLKLWNN